MMYTILIKIYLIVRVFMPVCCERRWVHAYVWRPEGYIGCSSKSLIRLLLSVRSLPEPGAHLESRNTWCTPAGLYLARYMDPELQVHVLIIVQRGLLTTEPWLQSK